MSIVRDLVNRLLGGGGGSGGGGSSVQSDWNQNDSNAADYVKNRPGGYETETVLVDGTYEFTLPEAQTLAAVTVPVYIAEVDINGELVSGETYFVEFDGETFELVAVGTGLASVGNLNLLSGAEQGDGEPFFAAVLDVLCQVRAYTPGSHTIKISQREVVPLPMQLTSLGGGYETVETTWSEIVSDSNWKGLNLKTSVWLAAGKTYKLTFDGVEHIGTAVFSNGIMEVTFDDGGSFSQTMTEFDIVLEGFDTTTFHTVVIEVAETVETVVPIPAKYLPIPAHTTADAGKVLGIDADGNLAWTAKDDYTDGDEVSY